MEFSICSPQIQVVFKFYAYAGKTVIFFLPMNLSKHFLEVRNIQCIEIFKQNIFTVTNMST